LSLAGYYHSQAYGNFQSVRALLGYGGLLLGLVLAALLPPLIGLYALAAGLLLSLFGFILPRIWLSSAASARAQRIRVGMPVLMENIALSLSAGVPLSESISESGRTLRRGYPELASEMRLVKRQSELSSLSGAIDQMRRRLPIPEVGSFAFLLIQSDRTGSDAVKGLQELADGYRVSARQRAEDMANKSNFWVLIPTITCLFVATSIFMIAPQILQLMKESRRILGDLERGQLGVPNYMTPQLLNGGTLPGSVTVRQAPADGRPAVTEMPAIPGVPALPR
jgi:pilus assembly protein TadC